MRTLLLQAQWILTISLLNNWRSNIRKQRLVTLVGAMDSPPPSLELLPNN